MFKRYIKFLILSLMLIFSLRTVCFADAYDTTVTYDESTEIVTVTGSAGADSTGKKVTLIVLKPNPVDLDGSMANDLSDLTDTNSEELIFALRQTNAATDGTFTFKYKWNKTMLGGNFVYKVAVQGDNTDEAERTTTQYFISDEICKNAVLALNTTDSAAMQTALEHPALELNVSNLSTTVVNKFIDIKGTTEFTSEADVTTVADMFATAIFYTSVDAGTVTVDELNAYITANLLTPVTGYSGNEAKVIAKFAASTPDVVTDADLIKLVNECTAVVAINDSTRTGATEILNTYKDILGITNTTAYNKYNILSADDKIRFNIEFVKTDYNTVAEVNTAFTNIAANFQPSGNNGASSGTPSAGGGGGGGGTPSRGNNSTNYTFAQTDNSAVESFDQKYAIKFDDIDSVEWAKEAIESFAKKGYISGVADGEFAPNRSITREEFVKILVNAFGLDISNAECTFTDCENSAWYTPYVAAAVEQGIVNGKSDTEFGIGEPITRQDLCVMAYRAAKKAKVAIPVESYPTFNDADSISDYAQSSVMTLAQGGVVTGTDGGSFEPTGIANRAQATVILYRLISLQN